MWLVGVVTQTATWPTAEACQHRLNTHVPKGDNPAAKALLYTAMLLAKDCDLSGAPDSLGDAASLKEGLGRILHYTVEPR